MRGRPGAEAASFSPRAQRLLVLSFLLLGLLLILHHPLWQDEWQAWLLARGSGSLSELFRHFHYDGHPGLWYLALYGLSRFTADPLAMQLCHLALATAAVWVFLRFAPFTRGQKILFSFGYFPFFEYAVISRNYAAGVLLIFGFCAVCCRDFPKKYLVLGGLLFLLCQTSIYGVLVALALGATIIFGELRGRPASGSFSTRQLLAFGAILGTGFILALWQIVPPPDSGFATEWRCNWDWPVLVRTVDTVWESYLPIPSLSLHFWNTNLLSQPYLKFGLALLLLGWAGLLFRRQPAMLLLFALGSLAILSFTYVKYLGSLRHHGHLFLVLIAALWLSRAYPELPAQSGIWPKGSDFCLRHRQAMITALFSGQLLAGLLAAGLSLAYPFSAGQAAARYIQDHGLAGGLIAGDTDDTASVISGCLNRPLYYLCAERWGTFVIWDQQRRDLELPEILQRARQWAGRQGQEVLLVLNRRVQTQEPDLIPLGQFTRSIVAVEQYYLYRLQGPQSHRTAGPGPRPQKPL